MRVCEFGTHRIEAALINRLMSGLILVRGGGDLASGVALRLVRSGFKVVISELSQPLAVRRTVSFAEAVYAGQVKVESVTAHLVQPNEISDTLTAGEIPVLVDPDSFILKNERIYLTNEVHRFEVVVDARMTKQPPDPLPVPISTHIGLGPGFFAGRDCHAVIETRRGHTLGRVYWKGETHPDSGLPDGEASRVLRAPCDGVLTVSVEIGQHVEKGQKIAEVVPDKTNDLKDKHSSAIVSAPLTGLVRGLLRPGIRISEGLKIGDIDPRDDPSTCRLVSDKALAIGGGVLEAILSHHNALQARSS
jgi:xanthine dehydrogenase accessory factor